MKTSISAVLLGLLVASVSFSKPSSQIDELVSEEALLRSEFETLQTEEILPSMFLARLKVETDPARRRTMIQEADRAFKVFQSNYDDFSNLKQRTFADIYRPRVECLAQYAETKKQHALYTEAMKNYQTYLDHQGDFGTNLDFNRITAYKNFFQKVRDLGVLVAKENGYELAKNPSLTPVVLKSIPQFLGLAKSLFFNASSAPGETPIQDDFSRLERKIAKSSGVKVEWYGQDNLPSMVLDGKNLYIYAYQHINPFLDNLTLGHFPILGVGMIGAVERVMPEAVAKQMRKSDHYIPVDQSKADGENESGLEKLERLVKSKKLAGYFLSPEGNTSAGLHDMRPPLPAFGDDLLREIWARGLEIHIIPLTFPDNFQLFTDYRIRTWLKTGPSVGVISPVLDSALLKEWVATTSDTHSVGRLVRAVWMENMRTNSDKLLSMEPASSLESSVREYSFPSFGLWDKKSCSAL